MITVQPHAYHRHLLHSLLRREYLINRSLVAQLLAAWLILIVILPLIASPNALAIYGIFGAVRLGKALGGQDLLGGYEETVFTAPPNARWRYLVRALGGLGLLLALLGGGSLVIAMHLPQLGWGLIVDSGLTARGPLPPWPSWLAVCGICGSLFTITFAVAANAGTAAVARSSSITACAALAAVAFACHVLIGRWYPDLPHGFASAIMVAVCCAVGGAVVPLGLWAYQRKQVSANVNAIAPPRSLLWVVIIAIVLGVVLATGTASFIF